MFETESSQTSIMPPGDLRQQNDVDWHLFEQVLDRIKKDINRFDRQKVLEFRSPTDLKKELNIKLPDNNISNNDLLKVVDQYIQYSAKTYHPFFCNQLWSGLNFPSLLAELLTTALNSSMYTYETSPVATLIEHALIEKSLVYAGFEKGEGIFTSGGSASNLSALLAARNHFDKNIVDKGINTQNLDLYVSIDSHYSMAKAANVLGLGIDNMKKVKVDSNGKMDVNDLRRLIYRSLDESRQPFFVCATAGTTVRGVYDPIDAIADICEEFNLWLHVDGAWGASVLWHEKYKKLMHGVDRADSLAWDAHKILGLPLMSAMLLFQNKGMLDQAHDHGDRDSYIFRDDDLSRLDLGPLSMQCGRKVDAVKLYFAWLMKGSKGLRDYVDVLMRRAQYFADKLRHDQRFVLFEPVDMLNICFQFKPSKELSLKQSNDLNLNIRTQLLQSGQAMINYAYIDEHLVIRLILANEHTDETHLDKLFEMIVETGEGVYSKI